jgi:AcrR family transcriptional regulator
MSKDTTKEKILSAARELFVKHGYAGASVGKIAKLAGVNHSLIFHHFGNKEKLWLETKLSIVNEAEKQASFIPSTDLSFKEFIQAAYDNLLDFYFNNNDIVRMVHWQRLEMNNEDGVKYLRSRGFDDWVNAIKVYQARGDVNTNLDAFYISNFLISAISSLGLDHYVFLRTAEEQKPYVEFCVSGLLKMFTD